MRSEHFQAIRFAVVNTVAKCLANQAQDADRKVYRQAPDREASEFTDAARDLIDRPGRDAIAAQVMEHRAANPTGATVDLASIPAAARLLEQLEVESLVLELSEIPTTSDRG